MLVAVVFFCALVCTEVSAGAESTRPTHIGISNDYTHSLLRSPGCANGVTRGRLGDNLIVYCYARWLSYTQGWDFHYSPFPLSDQLAMDTLHTLRFEGHTKTHVIPLTNILDIPTIDQLNDQMMFVLKSIPRNGRVNYNDPVFLEILRNEIKPKNTLEKVIIPEGHLSVALHIRRGGGFDRPLSQEDTQVSTTEWKANPRYSEQFVDRDYPLRFAPDSYFIEQLDYILTRFPDRKIYAHLFTDDPSPALIAEKYKKVLNNPRIEFGYRTSVNTHDSNVLEDFFGMSSFEVLIRPSSGFSSMAGRLGRPKIEIRPIKFLWVGNKLHICQVGILERDREQQWYMRESYLSKENCGESA